MNSIETMSELSSKIGPTTYIVFELGTRYALLPVSIFFGTLFVVCKIFMSQKKIQKKNTQSFPKDTTNKNQKHHEGGRPKPRHPAPVTD